MSTRLIGAASHLPSVRKRPKCENANIRKMVFGYIASVYRCAERFQVVYLAFSTSIWWGGYDYKVWFYATIFVECLKNSSRIQKHNHVFGAYLMISARYDLFKLGFGSTQDSASFIVKLELENRFRSKHDFDVRLHTNAVPRNDDPHRKILVRKYLPWIARQCFFVFSNTQDESHPSNLLFKLR